MSPQLGNRRTRHLSDELDKVSCYDEERNEREIEKSNGDFFHQYEFEMQNSTIRISFASPMSHYYSAILLSSLFCNAYNGVQSKHMS